MFFKQHSCDTKDPKQKYNSRAASLYRDKLASLVSNSFKLYGYTIELPHHSSSSESARSRTASESNEQDFFDESSIAAMSIHGHSQVSSNASISVSKPGPVSKDGLMVDSGTAASGNTSAYKPSLIGRKPAAAKKGMGGARKGLGAQKVVTDFDKVEQEALLAEKMRTQQQSTASALTTEEKEENLSSLKFVVEEKQKATERQLKSMDPKKAQQMERLGMGARSANISHSAMSDFGIVQQAPASSNSSSNRLKDIDRFDAQLDKLGFNSSSSSSSNNKKSFDDDFWGDTLGAGGASSSFSSNRDQNKNKNNSKPQIYDTIESIDLMPSRAGSSNKTKVTSSSNNQTSSSTSRNDKFSDNSSSNNNAQSKFTNAKSISSDQFFGNDRSTVIFVEFL